MLIAETERLLLSKITVEDAPFILELMNSPGWLKYIGDRQIKTIEATEDYIRNNQLKCYERHEFGYYKIALKSKPSTSLGTVGLLKRDNLAHIDIGFSLLPEYQGQGYAFEAATEIMHLAKHRFKIETLCAITLPINQPSINLLEKLGLSYQKKVKPFEDDTELLLFVKDL